MRIVFVVDARSPIARNWIEYFIRREDEVHIISSYPCSPELMPKASINQVPVAFSKLSRITHNNTTGAAGRPPLLARGLASLRSGALSGISTAVRFWLAPVELQRHVPVARELIRRIAPDIVHAMRIPFEGILAARATPAEIPLLVSVWGNDFTLFASRSPLIAEQTRETLARANGLHCDCRRDLEQATRRWGFDKRKPSALLPGAGGIKRSLFHRGEPSETLRAELNIPRGAPVIINPRGFRAYVRNDLFFQAIPRVLRSFPEAVFICSAMEGNPVAEKWIRRMKIEESVRLLPSVPHERMGDLFRLAEVAVSPSLHDGTPNTLLEAMACGCFPVAGDIESVREWITDGRNGLLSDPNDARALADSIILALDSKELRTDAVGHNARLIVERAEYDTVMMRADAFYLKIVQAGQKGTGESLGSIS